MDTHHLEDLGYPHDSWLYKHLISSVVPSRSLCASESVEQERRQTERGLELGAQLGYVTMSSVESAATSSGWNPTAMDAAHDILSESSLLNW